MKTQQALERTTPAAPEQPKVAPSSRKKPIVALVLLVAIAFGGYYVWRHFIAPPPIPHDLVVLSGRIEGDDSAVAPKVGGRILDLKVREGDQVKSGDVIATLDDAQIRAREDQAQFAVTQADSEVRAARQQITVINEQLRGANLQVTQSEQEASGGVRQAEAELAAAESSLAQQEASLKLAEFDREAYTRLAKSGAVSERQGKQAETTADSQKAVVASSRRRVESARAALVSARAALVNPAIRGSQSAMYRQQIGQQEVQIATAEARAAQARAALAEAKANRSDLSVIAPFDGTVATRTAEPGEVVTAGTPLITLIDLHKVYLRGFVPEGQIGRVKVNQPARIYLDSAPNTPVDAYVSRIDPQATFTPENTYFRDDRVKQVVGVKLQLKSAFGYAKPGMPADGEILVEGNQWPESPRKR